MDVLKEETLSATKCEKKAITGKFKNTAIWIQCKFDI